MVSSSLAGLGALAVLPSELAPLGGLGAAVAVWLFAGRVEPPGVRKEREAVRRDMVPLMALVASVLEAGAPPESALEVSAACLPGLAADRLASVRARLRLGGDPEHVWEAVSEDPVFAPLGRAITRAQRTGAPIATTVARLAQELAEQQLAAVEDRARSVGVKAAVPLGVCLLPAFLLLGIVPVAAGLLQTLI